MMTYYFSDQKNGVHDIHERTCKFLPNFHHRTLIGIYPTVEVAMNNIQKRFTHKQFRECSWCCSNHQKSD